MNKRLLVFMILHCISILLNAQHRADISYLVADFKYSHEHGLKICEVQHGALSAFAGNLYLTGQDGTITATIADFFTKFHIKKWASGIMYAPLQRSLAAQAWNIQPSFKALIQNKEFLEHAAFLPINDSCIHAYAGLVAADFDIIKKFSLYAQTYPGILFLNAATFPYWNDKYAMNQLFDRVDELKQYKADWRLYDKKYDPLLYQKIQQEMPAKLYVIKPRHEALAHGIIIVAAKDLEDTLQMILQPALTLHDHPDKKYAYWYTNKDDTFLVEKYYASDSICCSPPLQEESPNLTEYHYDATMRLACILQYDSGNMSYYPLGGFWKLPYKALEETGTLNETRISYCKPPFYKSIDHALLQEVDVHMKKAMLSLYELMLKER